MKKTVYYQNENDQLYTEREVKLMLLDKKTLKKRLLSRDEICRGRTVRFPKALFDYDESIGNLSTKDLRKAKVRKDLMRLGIEW